MQELDTYQGRTKRKRQTKYRREIVSEIEGRDVKYSGELSL